MPGGEPSGSGGVGGTDGGGLDGRSTDSARGRCMDKSTSGVTATGNVRRRPSCFRKQTQGAKHELRTGGLCFAADVALQVSAKICRQRPVKQYITETFNHKIVPNSSFQNI